MSIREILQVLGNPNQKGYPGTVNSDACLGVGVYPYQSAEVLFGPVGTRDDVLVRIEGLRRKGHYDKHNVCQKAKVGYCPCCTIPTHVGIPMSYRLGENDDRKQQAIDLWAQFGPWGHRRFCLLKYCYERNNREPFPIGWDWAANSLQKAFPPPLIRGTRAGPPYCNYHDWLSTQGATPANFGSSSMYRSLPSPCNPRQNAGNHQGGSEYHGDCSPTYDSEY